MPGRAERPLRPAGRPRRLGDDAAATPGQAAFLAGLDAFQAAGLLHDFEEGKRAVHRRPRHGRRCCWSRGRPGTGKSYGTAFAVFARLQGAMQDEPAFRVFLSCKTHAATDVLLKNVLEVREKLRELRDADPKLFAQHFDARLLDVPLYRVAPNDPPPDGVVHLVKDAEKEKGEDEERRRDPGRPAGRSWPSRPAASTGCSRRSGPRTSSATGCATCLVLDEASPDEPARGGRWRRCRLKPDAPLIVVGDHRQMPPIVKHDWDREPRRTFRQYQVYDTPVRHAAVAEARR